MKRILKSLAFGIIATAIVGVLIYILITVLNWLVSLANLAPHILPFVIVGLCGIIAFGTIAYQDKNLF